MTTAQSRYFFKPFIGSSHHWALRELDATPRNSSILDIGAGSGTIGQALRSKGFSKLTAVEIDPEARKHIAPIYNVTFDDLYQLNDQLFDLVIMLDVLEHLADPFAFYAKALSLLKPNGKALISVPNIAHWSIRLALLVGWFEYQDRGILDRTHLQFFTKKRFLQLLLSQSAVQLEKTTLSLPPYELVLPEIIWNNSIYSALSRCRLTLAGYFPGLFAYQHLAVIKIITNSATNNNVRN